MSDFTQQYLLAASKREGLAKELDQLRHVCDSMARMGEKHEDLLARRKEIEFEREELRMRMYKLRNNLQIQKPTRRGPSNV